MPTVRRFSDDRGRRGKGRAAHSPAGQGPARRRSVTMTRVRRGLAAVALLLVLAPAARTATLPLTARLAQALAVPGYPKDTSAAVAVDLTTGKPLFMRNSDLSLAPASNEKLPVTFAALRELGTSLSLPHRGPRPGPADRRDLAGRHLPEGIRRPDADVGRDQSARSPDRRARDHAISGRVLGDESWFDARRTAPGWKPDFYISESPPLSALVVDRAAYDNHVALRPALAAAGQLRRLLRRHGIASGSVGARTGPDRRDGARPGRLRTAAGDPPGDGPRERQLHGGADAEGARRRDRQERHDGGGRSGRAQHAGSRRRAARRRPHRRRLRPLARRSSDRPRRSRRSSSRPGATRVSTIRSGPPSRSRA